jgi:hypothetical protein
MKIVQRGCLEMSLKVKIKNRFEEDRGLALQVATKAGFKNATPLYKFVNEIDREMDNFNSLLIVVRELFDNELQEMTEYIMTLDPNKKTARYALEYVSINKMNEVRKHLIEKMLNCKNTESKEWASIYNISMLGDEGITPAMELLEMLNDIAPKSLEMICYKEIEKFYCFYDLKICENMITKEQFIKNSIKKIKDDFIRNSYGCRLAIIGIDAALHSNNIDKVREYENEINLEYNCNITKYYLQVGNSYMFENFEKAKDHLQLAYQSALKIDSEHRRKEAERSLNFLHSYWCKEAPFLNFNSNEVSDIHEIAFYYIRKNDDRGLMLLEVMDQEKMTDHNKGFHFFMRGLATGDEDFFWDSLMYFNKAGEKYYKYVSLNELRKLGISDRRIMALAV